MQITSRYRKGKIAFAAALTLLVALSGCKAPRAAEQEERRASPAASASQAAPADQTAPTAPAQPIAAAEVVPAGDIPDSQVFIAYASSPGGYELQVPEGWGRTEGQDEVRFTDKFDAVRVQIIRTDEAFSLRDIERNQVPRLEKAGRNVTVKGLSESALKGGKAIVVSYDSDSEPDSVTAKRIRLENKSYYFHRPGTLAVLTVWAPLGSDNVDQWDLMSNSFRWH